MTLSADKIVDATGLMCPEPLLKVKIAMEQLASGQRVHVICTDPASVIDFKAYAAVTAHRLCEHHQSDGQYHFLIEKGAAEF